MPLLAFWVLLALSSTAYAEDAASSFTGFCEEWMHKLEARQQRNVSNIKWESKPDGVKGEYIGYSQEHTCTLKNNAKVPVGKITYREVRYEKRGGTIPEAERSPAQAVEITEVTEIFRYGGGKWVY